MVLTDVIADMLGGKNGELVRKNAELLAEVRLRVGRRVRLSRLDGGELSGERLEAEPFRRLIARLMEHSLYAREAELRQGYFTSVGGCRVGVCGKMNVCGDRIESLCAIGSACIRIPREARGCGQGVYERLSGGRLKSLLILSPPGLGKTTLLRDLVRLISDGGFDTALADERRELAACVEGVPQLDVGSRTDVVDGCPKALAIPMLVRACAPKLVAADEIGGPADGEALREARRCGVQVAATAHAASFEEACARPFIGPLIRDGIFDLCIVLGPKRGEIMQIREIGTLRESE